MSQTLGRDNSYTRQNIYNKMQYNTTDQSPTLSRDKMFHTIISLMMNSPKVILEAALRPEDFTTDRAHADITVLMHPTLVSLHFVGSSEMFGDLPYRGTP